MAKHKYTTTDVEKISKVGLYSLIFIFLSVIMSDVVFDDTLSLKDKVIGFAINSSVVVICYFVGEAFRKRYVIKQLARSLGVNEPKS